MGVRRSNRRLNAVVSAAKAHVQAISVQALSLLQAVCDQTNKC